MTRKFDKCGFLFNNQLLSKDEEGNDVQDDSGASIITYPSKSYKNVYALLDDPDLKPAFFKDYIFRADTNNKLEKDIKQPNKRPRCYLSANYITASTALLSAAAFAIFA